MKCRDVVSHPPITVTPDKTLEEAVELLANHDVGLLVVVDRDNPRRPIGVLSERDVVRAIGWKAPLTVTVREAGTFTGLIYVYADDPVEKAFEVMMKHNIRHVLVLEQNGNLLGVISIRDLAKFCKLSSG
ncbi:putative signal-transduction protein containing cAMP-binding and CBS domains [Pyrobaculum oguniense TE7]|uniref:Signal-transduction protein containing cAMP-binding and CBS domains n=1 Tax=Pyrobaculum oguniense (strain DSM 13380 / JCM 10595 / TE7) TaxID=698757 RepID=H6QAG5_PYROT|nr:putative signal-transduction protein containing cAMP-binding and CBS domains [Pyrobaculum oguniense TE7]